jgi:hypothetical protein
MVDTPTPNYGLRNQELGSNIASWGDPNLNELFSALDQILGKIKDIAITGDYTITSTNYVTTADNKNRGWRFTGTLTALATITVPATHTSFIVVNDTTGGFSLTVKTSAGTGITVPAGRTAWLRCNATNVLNAFPTHMGTTFTPSLSGDAANVNYVQTAIATASLPATAGTQLISGSDITAGYTSQKFTVSLGSLTTTQVSGLTSLALSIENPGANEKLKLTPGEGYVSGYLPGGVQSSTFIPVVGTAYNCDFSSASWTVNLSGMTTPQLEQRIKISCFGNNPAFLLGTVNGLSNLYLDAGFSGELTYTGASWGWN